MSNTYSDTVYIEDLKLDENLMIFELEVNLICSYDEVLTDMPEDQSPKKEDELSWKIHDFKRAIVHHKNLDDDITYTYEDTKSLIEEYFSIIESYIDDELVIQ